MQRNPSLFPALYNREKEAALMSLWEPPQGRRGPHSATSVSQAKAERAAGRLVEHLFHFFFLISSEMNMNTLWSLHSVGANPPPEALGSLVPPHGGNLSTQAFLRALLKGPRWMERLSPWSSITFTTPVF